MNRITKVITTIAATIISMDILLMVINGTIFYVILTMVGLYALASLAFKRSAYLVILHWLNAGKHQGDKEHDQFTRTN